ncbi:PIN domain-containing protein [Burkholderiaceae bacterium DAT-1]|nr:PIN domain-containing protein [Burkholderiaceae bacterium DAT-1]
MSDILVDTSVWVDHFQQNNQALVDLLLQDRALSHPLIIGEIACGTPPNRSKTLADLQCLRPASQATIDELLEMIERDQLAGKGCGLVDLLLLASTLITANTRIWTLDRRLHALAVLYGVAYEPMHH